jgi:hypothetical protein
MKPNYSFQKRQKELEKKKKKAEKLAKKAAVGEHGTEETRVDGEDSAEDGTDPATPQIHTEVQVTMSEPGSESAPAKA